MNVYRSLEAYQPPPRPVVTIGTFDGVHEGHKTILRRLNQVAREIGGESLLLTFWPHPRMVLDPPDENLRLLNTIEEKMAHLKEAGLQNLLMLPFTDRFSKTSPYNFIRDVLAEGIRVRYLIIGYDHRFGRKREGSLDTLKQYAPEFGYELEEIPAHNIDEATVSSTKIRKALLEEGDIRTANAYLGYAYSLTGEVVSGDQLGREMGYPTANISVPEWYKLVPADGVYAVTAQVWGNRYQGMLNIGNRPTVNGRHRRIEVNLFDFKWDIYGENMTVYFHAYLRDQVKFEDMAQLRQQLDQDRADAIAALKDIAL